MDPRLKVKMTRFKGRGVFANCRIRKGEIIETAPVILLSKREETIFGKTRLISFCYEWEGIGRDKRRGTAFVMGLASFYNHSYNPNATYHMQSKRKALVFTALKNIAKGEEITHNYNGDLKDQSPIRFKGDSWKRV